MIAGTVLSSAWQFQASWINRSLNVFRIKESEAFHSENLCSFGDPYSLERTRFKISANIKVIPFQEQSVIDNIIKNQT